MTMSHVGRRRMRLSWTDLLLALPFLCLMAVLVFVLTL